MWYCTVPQMEWAGVWASQYPSNEGKDGRVDLIRVDHKVAKAPQQSRIVATKLTGADCLRAPLLSPVVLTPR